MSNSVTLSSLKIPTAENAKTVKPGTRHIQRTGKIFYLCLSNKEKVKF